MAESYLEKVANELADLALADQVRSGDIGIVDVVGELLGASSQTLQESFLTAVRIRRAEKRARELLGERAGTPIIPDAELLEDNRAAQNTMPDIEDAEVADDMPDTVQVIAAPTPQVDYDALKRIAAEEAQIAAEAAARAEEEKAIRDAEIAEQRAKEEAEAAKAKAEAEAKAKKEAEAKAKAAAPKQPVLGPWDMDEDGSVDTAPAASPRRVTR